MRNNRHIALITSASLILTLIFSFPVFAEGISSDPPEAAISGEYVPGDVILCIKTDVADEKKIASQSAGIFKPEPDIDSGFLMDVSKAAEAFEEEGVAAEANGKGKEGLSSLFSSALTGVFPSIKKDSGKTVMKLIHSDTMPTEELIKLYSGKPGVVFAEPNYLQSIDGMESAYGVLKTREPEGAVYGSGPAILTSPSNSEAASEHAPDITFKQYAFNDGPGGMDVPDWNNPDKINAKDTVVAVVDSGVDYENEDLKDVMWDKGLDYPSLKALGGGKYGINAGYENYYADKPTAKDDPMDNNGHGTHCAGIIAAAWNGYGVSGAANGAKIMAVKHASNDNGQSAISATIKGFNYISTARDAGVNVVAVNCSFGGFVSHFSHIYCTKELSEKGIVVCWATGNDHMNTDIYNASETSVISDFPGMIAVASMDDEGERSIFSNYGIRTASIFAPGSGIYSTIARIKSEVIPDKVHSEPVSDENGKVFYDDFQSNEHAFIYEANDNNGTKMKFENNELQLSGTDYSKKDEDSITGETLGEGEENRVAVLAVKPDGKLKKLSGDKKYSLVFKMRVEDMGEWNLMVYVKTISGSFERPRLTPAMKKKYNYDTYILDKSLKGNEFDLDDPEIRFVLHNQEFTKTLKKAAIGELWITDAPIYPYANSDGTSMAAPAVAGETAIIAASFPKESAAKRAARVLAGAVQNDDLKKLCITGGAANVRNSLDEDSYTPVINSISAEKDGLHINGFFFGELSETEVNITQYDSEWSVSGHTLNIKEIRENKDGSEEIILNIPEGMRREKETCVTVTDRGRINGRQSFSRLLIPVDTDGVLIKADDVCQSLPLSDATQLLLKNLRPINGIALNGSLYFNFRDEIDDCYSTVEYKDGTWRKTEEPAFLDGGSITAWNGMIVSAGSRPDTGRLYFHDGTRVVKTLDFEPVEGGEDIPEGEDWILEKPDENDMQADLYYDGEKFLYFRTKYFYDEAEDAEYYDTVVYSMDPETGKGKYLGELNNVYLDSMLIAHEEKDGKPSAIYVTGSGINENEEYALFIMEKITLDPFKAETLSDSLPEGLRMEEWRSYRGCGVKNGIYMTLPYEATENEDGTGKVTSDNYFFDFSHTEDGFKPGKKRMADTRAYQPVAVAGYGKVYFLGIKGGGFFMSYTEEDTLPHYGDTPEKQKEKTEKRIDYSDPASPLHLSDGEGISTVSTGNARYVFTLSSNAAVIGGTKADVSGFFETAAGYDSSAKHRYISSDKKIAKLNKKGVLTPKKRGEIDISCEQKVKGGSWKALDKKMHLFVQIPEMQKKADANMGDSGLSAYSYLCKTTFSPTSWKSTNAKVATVDENGNIMILKPGRTNIIAEYGEGKTGSKKKYRTKLKVR